MWSTPRQFDDSAISDPPLSALIHHARQLGFQSLQPSNAASHGGQMVPGDRVDGRAGPSGIVRHRQHRADGVDREAQFAAMPDESQPIGMGLRIDPVVAGGARRWRQYADLFVITDRLDLGADA
jgi:hypothetical protein